MAPDLALDDGARTSLEWWGQSGPILLCVHGMTSSRLSWRRFAERFAHAFRIVAYDQRGHGDSAGVAGPMSLARGVRDLENVVAAIDEPIRALVGHSWGGAVAIRGGAHPRVERVLAIDPMLRQVEDAWYEEFLAELREQFALEGSARDAFVRADYAPWHPLDVAGKVHAVHAMSVAPIEGLQRENPASTWNLMPDLERSDKPIMLALAGAEGTILDAVTYREVLALTRPNVRIVTFENEGHNLHRTDFDAFAAAAEGFLA